MSSMIDWDITELRGKGKGFTVRICKHINRWFVEIKRPDKSKRGEWAPDRTSAMALAYRMAREESK